MKGVVPKLLLALLLLTLASGGWAGYKIYVLAGEKAALLEEVSSLERKVLQFKNKLAEEKALVSQYGRIKANLESELRAVQAQRDELEEKVTEKAAQLQAEIEKLKKSGEEAAAKHQQEIERYKDAISQWKDQYEALREESIAKITERDEQIASLTNQNQSLDSELSAEKQEHNHCRRANARFSELSQKLVKRYKDKDAIDAIITNEPLTQLEKVELEKMVQEFQDAIDKNAL